MTTSPGLIVPRGGTVVTDPVTAVLGLLNGPGPYVSLAAAAGSVPRVTS